MQLSPAGLLGRVSRALLVGLVALLALSAALALRSPADAQPPPNDSFIRSGVTDDVYRDKDVYLVKIVNDKRFKRLMLHGPAFCAYGCPWDEILPSDRSVMDDHMTSWLGRLGSDKDADVYLFLTTGEDSGIRQHLNMERSEIERAGYDWDSVFSTEPDDFYAYDEGRVITCDHLNSCNPPPRRRTLPTPPTSQTVPPSGSNEDGYVSLDFATINGEANVGCRMTLADGSGAPNGTYAHGDQVKGACPIRNAYDSSREVTLSMWVETTEGALDRIAVISTSIAADTVRDVHLPEGILTTTARVGPDRPIRFELYADGATVAKGVNEDHLVEIVPTQDIGDQPERAILDYAGYGSCQISGTDGDGQRTYQLGQNVLLSCSITNTHSTWQPIVLTITLSHTNGRNTPIDLYALTVPPRTTDRQKVNFAIPEGWPAGNTTVQSTLLTSHDGDWHTQSETSTDPFIVVASPTRRMATTPDFNIRQAVPGETVSVSWIHRNPFPHEITDTAALSVVCGDATQAAAIVLVRVAAHQSTNAMADLHLPSDTPVGDCYLNYLITDSSNVFVEGWSATPLNQRPEYARIHLQVRSAESDTADSAEALWPRTEPCAAAPAPAYSLCMWTFRATYKVAIAEQCGLVLWPIARWQCEHRVWQDLAWRSRSGGIDSIIRGTVIGTFALDELVPIANFLDRQVTFVDNAVVALWDEFANCVSEYLDDPLSATLSVVEGFVVAQFNEANLGCSALGELAAGFIFWGDFVDVLDCTADNVNFLLDNSSETCGLGRLSLAVVGFIPVAGDTVKVVKRGDGLADFRTLDEVTSPSKKKSSGNESGTTDASRAWVDGLLQQYPFIRNLDGVEDAMVANPRLQSRFELLLKGADAEPCHNKCLGNIRELEVHGWNYLNDNSVSITGLFDDAYKGFTTPSGVAQVPDGLYRRSGAVIWMESRAMWNVSDDWVRAKLDAIEHSANAVTCFQLALFPTRGDNQLLNDALLSRIEDMVSARGLSLELVDMHTRRTIRGTGC